MAVYDAVERLDAAGVPTGLFYFTQDLGTSGTYRLPTGYCADLRGCPGHAAQADAYAHQRAYLFDNTQYDGWTEGAAEPCVIDAVSSYRFAFCPGVAIFFLCETHANAAGVQAYFATITSYTA